MKHICICNQDSWGVVVIVIAIMTMAVVVSIWQNNPNYLWLIALVIGVSPNKCKATKHEEDD